MLNFQDVIRDVHNPTTHTLQTSSGGATIFAVVNTATAGDSVNNIGFATVSVSNPTLYAVVNTLASSGLATVDIRNTINANVSLSDSISNIGFATVAVSTPTLYAVVNTGAAGVGNSIVTINPRTDYFGLVSVSGNVAISSLPETPVGTKFIGLATVWNANQQPLVASTVNIGSVSVLGGTIAVSSLPALVASNVNIGSVSVLGGSIKLDTNTLNIGSVSVLGGTINSTLQTSTLNIGSVSVLGGGIGLNAGVNGIGFATVKVDTGTKYIGLVTIDVGTIKAWTNPNTFIGLVTVAPPVLTTSTANIGSVSVLGGGIGINAGVNSIGFATVWALNVGTNKSLVNLPIAFSVASVATIAVPTNANTIKISNMLLNSDATVRFTIKSGVTYLTGNASIGVTLNPGGGFIMTGSPDSPSWIGLPSGALVVEKLDLTGTSAKIAGNVVYWQE